jgi:hypothetical protein
MERPRISGETRKGAIIKLFGVVLVVLGTLNSMLMWRGGFDVSELYLLMIVSGLFVYGIGSVKSRAAN